MQFTRAVPIGVHLTHDLSKQRFGRLEIQSNQDVPQFSRRNGATLVTIEQIEGIA